MLCTVIFKTRALSTDSKKHKLEMRLLLQITNIKLSTLTHLEAIRLGVVKETVGLSKITTTP